VTRNWTTKVEYLYADLGDKGAYTTPAGPYSVDLKSHILRMGLNYKF
jgi:opacity protein-like surface antigen